MAHAVDARACQEFTSLRNCFCSNCRPRRPATVGALTVTLQLACVHLDATFTGSSGFARAHRHESLLTSADIRYQLRQELDDGWTLRLGPVAAAEVGAAVAAFIGDGL